MRLPSPVIVAASLGIALNATPVAAQGLVATNVAALPYRVFASTWDPVRRGLFVSDRDGHRVQRIAPDGSVTAIWTATAEELPEALALSPDRRRIAVALPGRPHDPFWDSGQTGTVAVLDAATLAPVRKLPVPIDPFDVALLDDGRLVVSGGSGSTASVALFAADGSGPIGSVPLPPRSYLSPMADGKRLYVSTTDQSPSSLRRLELGAAGLTDSGRAYGGGLAPRSRPEPMPGGSIWILGGGDLLALSPDAAPDLAPAGSLASDQNDPVQFEGTAWDAARSLLIGVSTVPDARLRAYRLGSFAPVGSWTLDRPVTGLYADGTAWGGLVRESGKTWIVRLQDPGNGALANRPPEARVVVVEPPATFRPLTFDASGSTDDQTPATSLRFRWDWDADGTFDTGFTNDAVAVHRFFEPGRHAVRVQARDEYGAVATTEVVFDVAAVPDGGVPGDSNPPFVLGFGAAGVAFDGPRHRAYASDALAQQVVAVDLDTGLEARRWTVPGYPRKMRATRDSSRLYVVLSSAPPPYLSASPGGAIAEFDLPNARLLRVMPVDVKPHDVAATDDGTLLVSSESGDSVSDPVPLVAYRLSDGAPTRRIDGDPDLDFLPDPDGKSVWAMGPYGSTARVLRLDLLPSSSFAVGYQGPLDPTSDARGVPIGGHRLLNPRGRIVSADDPSIVIAAPGNPPTSNSGAALVGGGWIVATTPDGLRYLADGADAWLPWNGDVFAPEAIGLVGDRHAFALVGSNRTRTTFQLRSMPAVDPSTNHAPLVAWRTAGPVGFRTPGSTTLKPGTWSDDDGAVVALELWRGQEKVADIPVSGFGYDFYSAVAVTNEFYFVARDNLGGATTSAVQRVIGRRAPSLALQGPSVLGSLPGSTTEASFVVTPGDGPVARVDVGINRFPSMLVIAQATNAPWHVALPPVATDTALSAVAYDDLGISSGSVSLTLHVDGAEGDDFYRPFALSGTAPRDRRSNREATAQRSESPVATAGHSLWWRWTAPSNGVIVVSTAGSSVDTYIAVVTGNELGKLKTIASGHDGPGGSPAALVKLQAVAGTEYSILVDSPYAATGDVSLSIEFEPGPPAPGAPPANDTFAKRTVIAALPSRQEVDTTGATVDTTDKSLGKPGQHSAWWEWVAPADGVAAFTTSGSDFDTWLAAYRYIQFPLAFVPLATNDDVAIGDRTSRVQCVVKKGQRIIVAVDGFLGASGHAVLDGTFEPAPGTPPPNASPDNAIPLAGMLAQAAGSTLAVPTLWWSWTAPRSAQAFVSTDDPAAAVQVFASGPGTNLTVVTYRSQSKLPNQAAFNALGGRTYWIRVTGSTTLAYTLALDASLPPFDAWSTTIAVVPDGWIVLRLNGPANVPGVLQSSADMTTWQDVVRQNWRVGQTYWPAVTGETVYFRLVLDP